MTKSLPPISIIIPTFNEEGFITDCINSLIKSDYPYDLIEILVIDGMSTDATQKKVRSLIALHPSIKLLKNIKKIVPCALNIGINQACHQIIIWAGAHAIYKPDYLVRAVKILTSENCASVGGVIKPVGKTRTGQAIATATSHKFGIGNAKYRHSNKRQAVDTVFGGCWKKANIIKIGGFNEQWLRNQDYELNHRLRKQIGPIILDPSIRCEYFCRETIPNLAIQYFEYGYWRFKTALKHPSSLTLRQLAPLLLLTSLFISALLAFIHPLSATIVPLSYGLCTILVSLHLSFKNQRIDYILLLPLVFATLHLSWASGFLKNAFDTSFNKNESSPS